MRSSTSRRRRRCRRRRATCFFSSLHPAETPKGLRLVQIDAEATVARAERGKPRLEHFDPSAFGLPVGARLAYPVAAFVALCDLSLPRIRFLCRADLPAFAGPNGSASDPRARLADQPREALVRELRVLELEREPDASAFDSLDTHGT